MREINNDLLHERLFENNQSLVNVVLPRSVKTISSYAFSGR